MAQDEASTGSRTLGDVEATAIAATLDDAATALDLSDNAIGEAGARAIAVAIGRSGSQLRDLDLHSNALRAAGAGVLARAICAVGGQGSSCCRVATLDLSSNELGAQGATQLADALAAAPSPCALSCLSLGDNALGDEGATKIAHALCAPGAGRLAALHLWDNGISSAGTARLASALGSGMAPLRVLDLSYNEGIDALGGTALAEVLAKTAVLRRLVLSNCSIGDAGASALAMALLTSGGHGAGGLRALDVSACGLTASSAARLAETLIENTRLTEVDLSDNPGIGVAAAATMVEVQAALDENKEAAALGARARRHMAVYRIQRCWRAAHLEDDLRREMQLLGVVGEE